MTPQKGEAFLAKTTRVILKHPLNSRWFKPCVEQMFINAAGRGRGADMLLVLMINPTSVSDATNWVIFKPALHASKANLPCT